MKLDRGYISSYFITNQKTQKCELDDPLILIHEKKITSVNAIVKALDLALKAPLIVNAFTGTYGINYGRLADNIPSLEKVVRLLRAAKIRNARIFDFDQV